MRFGLALPQYDYSVAGEDPLEFETIAEHARARRARVGFDSVWLSDHLFLDIAKYGGPADRVGVLRADRHAGARWRASSTASGSARSCSARRCGPPSVLAKALATLDRICGGRLDVGLGAGWYEPEYAAIGMAMPPPGERIAPARARRSTSSRGLLGGGPLTFDGRFHRAPTSAVELPAGACSSRARRCSSAARATGCSDWSPSTPTGGTRAGRGRPTRTASGSRCSSARARPIGRDPATVWRSLGLYALVRRGRDRPRAAVRAAARRGAARRARRASTSTSAATGRLVGHVEQVREQAGEWGELGVDTLIARRRRRAVPGRAPATTSSTSLRRSAERLRSLSSDGRSRSPGNLRVRPCREEGLT